MIYESSVEELHADHERWVAQGLMTAEQVARIEAREQRRNRKATRPRNRRPADPSPAEPTRR